MDSLPQESLSRIQVVESMLVENDNSDDEDQKSNHTDHNGRSASEHSDILPESVGFARAATVIERQDAIDSSDDDDDENDDTPVTELSSVVLLSFAAVRDNVAMSLAESTLQPKNIQDEEDETSVLKASMSALKKATRSAVMRIKSSADKPTPYKEYSVSCSIDYARNGASVHSAFLSVHKLPSAADPKQSGELLFRRSLMDVEHFRRVAIDENGEELGTLVPDAPKTKHFVFSHLPVTFERWDTAERRERPDRELPAYHPPHSCRGDIGVDILFRSAKEKQAAAIGEAQTAPSSSAPRYQRFNAIRLRFPTCRERERWNRVLQVVQGTIMQDALRAEDADIAPPLSVDLLRTMPSVTDVQRQVAHFLQSAAEEGGDGADESGEASVPKPPGNGVVELEFLQKRKPRLLRAFLDDATGRKVIEVAPCNFGQMWRGVPTHTVDPLELVMVVPTTGFGATFYAERRDGATGSRQRLTFTATSFDDRAKWVAWFVALGARREKDVEELERAAKLEESERQAAEGRQAYERFAQKGPIAAPETRTSAAAAPRPDSENGHTLSPLSDDSLPGWEELERRRREAVTSDADASDEDRWSAAETDALLRAALSRYGLDGPPAPPWVSEAPLRFADWVLLKHAALSADEFVRLEMRGETEAEAAATHARAVSVVGPSEPGDPQSRDKATAAIRRKNRKFSSILKRHHSSEGTPSENAKSSVNDDTDVAPDIVVNLCGVTLLCRDGDGTFKLRLGPIAGDQCDPVVSWGATASMRDVLHCASLLSENIVLQCTSPDAAERLCKLCDDFNNAQI